MFVNPKMISSVKKNAAYLASSVIVAWNMSKGRAEKTTPTPKAEARRIAEKKSIRDLVKRRSGEPPVPS